MCGHQAAVSATDPGWSHPLSGRLSCTLSALALAAAAAASLRTACLLACRSQLYTQTFPELVMSRHTGKAAYGCTFICAVLYILDCTYVQAFPHQHSAGVPAHMHHDTLKIFVPLFVFFPQDNHTMMQSHPF